MKIVVVGTGYVGLSNAVLLSQKHEVVSLDIDSKRVENLNKKILPIHDEEMLEFFASSGAIFKRSRAPLTPRARIHSGKADPWDISPVLIPRIAGVFPST